jgi:acyl-coenzyme A thioesterase PaaI-like protein
MVVLAAFHGRPSVLRRPPDACMLRPVLPLQDLYPDDFAHCYGCGRLNTHGLHVKSEWRSGESIAHFQPAPYHIALPGFVYGGLIASLADCHAMATAAGAVMAAAGALPGRDQTPRFVTASLHVDYLRPTPTGHELVLRSRAAELGERRVVVEMSIFANDVECARARVVAVPAPATMRREAGGSARL